MAGVDPLPDDASTSESFTRALAPMVASATSLLAIAGLTWALSEALPQPWAFLLALVTLGAGLLGGWNMLQLGIAWVMARVIDRAVSNQPPPPSALGKRFRLGLWPLIPAFIITWALNGVFLGLDRSQWTWTGISTLLGCVAVVATSVRVGSADGN